MRYRGLTLVVPGVLVKQTNLALVCLKPAVTVMPPQLEFPAHEGMAVSLLQAAGCHRHMRNYAQAITVLK